MNLIKSLKMPRFNIQSLGIRLNIFFVLIFALFLAALLIVTRVGVTGFTKDLGQTRAEQEATLIQNRLVEAADGVLVNARLLAASSGLIEAVAAGNSDELEALVLIAAAPLKIDDADIVDAEGRRLLDTVSQETDTGFFEGEDALLSLALLGISDAEVIVSVEDEEPALSLAGVVPLRDNTGTIVGALLASREINDAFLDEIDLFREDIGLAVVTNEGVLAHNLASGQSFEKHADQTQVQQALNGNFVVSNEIVSSDEGAQQILAYTPLSVGSAPESVLGISVDVSELVRLQNSQTSGATITFLFFTLLAISGLSFINRHMLSIPLNRLRTVAEDIAEGDYSQRSDLHSQDEIGVLSETINVMAGKLQDTLAGLENTVEERTKELNQRAVEMEASQRVTFAASENTTPDDLLDLVTNLVRDVFDLYHAQVYLVDEKGENAVLRESTGYAGRQLLQKNHSIPLNQAALVTTAINSAEPVLVSDVSKDERHLANPLLPETRSELVTPLVIEGKVLGALDIQSREAGFFSERSIELFKSMSDQIALLFEKSQLLEQVTEQAESLIEFTEKLRAAAEVAEQLSPILDPEQLLSVGVVLLQSHFNLYHAHVYLLDDSKENLVMHTGSGRVGVLLRQQGHSIPLTHESSVVARAAREVHPVLISDTEKETAHLPNPLLPNTRSELALPLVVAGQVIGVLDLQDETPNHFTQIDTDTFTTLSGQIASSLQTARVFTEQQKTQAALKDSEAQFRILVENAPEAIVVVDVDTGKFIEGNENAEQLYGLRHDKLISVGPADVSPPIQPDGARSIDKAMKHLHQALQGEIPVFDWIHLNSDGEEIPCEVRLAHLPAAGRNLVRASVTNISERKQAQDAIVQSDRLKSEFLANMSHELRTPLNSIVGYTDVLLMGLDGELEEEKRLDVVAIQQNSNELLRIINDILDLAKIEAGRMIFELSEIDVKKLLHDVQKSNAGLLVNKPVEVRIEAEEGLPDITADEGRLTQVLNNLVSNAVKFTEEGTVTIRATQSGGYVQIDVEDTGVGISEEDLEVIFEQFRQADGSIARPEEGTGLGLAITRSLVNLHGGTIDVQSELGKGSIFTVRLPIDNHISPDVVIVNRDKTNGDSVRQTAPFLEQAVEQKANGDLPDLNAG